MKKPRVGQKQKPVANPLGLDLDDVTSRLRAGKGTRRTLTPWGRLHIDRPLPFLCVYRRSADSDPKSANFVTSQASYLLVPGEPEFAEPVRGLIRALVTLLVEDFGACLLIEVGLMAPRPPTDGAPSGLGFRIVTTPDGEPASTIAELEAELGQAASARDAPAAEIELKTHPAPAPDALAPIFSSRKRPAGCSIVVLEVSSLHQAPSDDKTFPLLKRRLRRDLARALKHAAFEFTTRRTTQRPSHFHAFGRTNFVKAVFEADQRLAKVSGRFDFLFLSTPRNAAAAWAEFRQSGFKKTPRFSYPPLAFDPAIAKRELYDIRLERIEDPTLEDLFREQQDELDRKITMLADRGTPRFKYGSLQLFGPVDDALLAEAESLLDELPFRSRDSAKGGKLDARAFAALAEKEIEYLRGDCADLSAKVRIRADVNSLMVSSGNLLVPEGASIPSGRVEALLQHEVGTHVLTYYNGAAQPFRQLRNGLPRYEELQEGLAVLAEYLVGGLSAARLRLLAARVVAVRRMTHGATFADVFRELSHTLGFTQKTAFGIALRVFRGGGLGKDAVYLRGLVELLGYLARGGLIEPLLVGKIGLHHLDVLEDLRVRGALVPARFRPRYLDQPATAPRLEALRKGARIVDLARPPKRRAR